MLFLALAPAGAAATSAATATTTARTMLTVRFFSCSYSSDHHCHHDDVDAATVSVPYFPEASIQNRPSRRFGVWANSFEGEIQLSSHRTWDAFGFNRSCDQSPKPFEPEFQEMLHDHKLESYALALHQAGFRGYRRLLGLVFEKTYTRPASKCRGRQHGSGLPGVDHGLKMDIASNPCGSFLAIWFCLSLNYCRSGYRYLYQDIRRVNFEQIQWKVLTLSLAAPSAVRPQPESPEPQTPNQKAYTAGFQVPAAESCSRAKGNRVVLVENLTLQAGPQNPAFQTCSLGPFSAF